jgi:hypothetical protein
MSTRATFSILTVGWLILLMSGTSFSANPVEKANPSLVRKGDLEIWDEVKLDHCPKGWTCSATALVWLHGHPLHLPFPGMSPSRFGRYSGSLLYTTMRGIRALTAEEYTEGKKTVYDTHVASITTPPFEIKLDYITFLLSGGNSPGVACANLLVDGKILRTATGRDRDTLEWVAFGVEDLKGRTAQFQLLDAGRAANEYVTVDCVCQSADTRDAVRVIRDVPQARKTISHIKTLTGVRKGAVLLKEGSLLVDGQAMKWNEIMSWQKQRRAGRRLGKRVLLVNQDCLAGDVSAFEGDRLKLKHAVLGELSLPIEKVAQFLFTPAEAFEAKPGTLIHANGSRIPGELIWIRGNEISVKCALGQLPLPKTVVQAFVFREQQDSASRDTVLLSDGSSLSGTLHVEKDRLVLTHDMLGRREIDLEHLVSVSRCLPGVTPFVDLAADVREQVGPIKPPGPLLIKGGLNQSLRVYSRTALSYELPTAKSRRRFRGRLRPAPNSRTPQVVEIACAGTTTTYTIPPESEGVGFDVDLGTENGLAITVDYVSTIGYPCGVEWHDAFIVAEDKE